MEKERTVDLRPVLVLVAAALAAAALWAATALAGGDSSTSSGSSSGGSPAAVFVQDTEPPAREDCPERDGSGGNGAAPVAARVKAPAAAPPRLRPSDPRLRRGLPRWAAPSIKIGT